MNAPAKITQPMTIDAAHILRSRVIERCAMFESLLFQVIAAAGISLSAKAPVGQRIDAITSALAAKDKLNRHDKRLSAILEKAGPAIALRNELAHGTMVLATIDAEIVLLVKNAQAAMAPCDQRVLVHQSDLDAALSLFASLNNQLRQVISPPLPRPPAPGATTGP